MKEKEFGAEELYLAPETEISAETEVKQEISHQTELVEKDTKKAPFEVDEISNLRKANKKVFRMSDGYEKAVFYPETLHVFDSNTKNFEKVDNSLIEEEDGQHIRNGAGAFVARFSKEIENDEIFSVEKGGHKITVFARKNKKNMNHGSIPKIRKQMLADLDSHEIDMISFADIVEGSDMEYSVTGNGVKEDIIVKTKSAVYRYPFILECENVFAEYMEAEKTVAFKDPETNLEIFSIPAPFMTDAEGVVSTAVAYELKELAFGKYAFTVTADNDWINAEDRVLPVTIDPQILVQGSAYMSTYSWDNGSLYSSTIHKVGTSGNGDGTCNAKRMYLSFEMPTLPRNPRIKKAELTIKQSAGYCQGGALPKIGLYNVTEDICIGNYTPIHSSNLIDFVQMKTGVDVSYTFDITTLVDKINKGEMGHSNFVLKMLDEDNICNNYVNLYGCAYSTTAYKPTISITYENTYGINTSYRSHSHEIGRFGQGSIDLQCGNLMFESEDFAWVGNRMPVTLKHFYNSALASYQYTKNSAIKLNAADFTSMKLGYGWRFNLMQSMVSATFQHEGVSYSGYVFTDENGEETYFKLSTTKRVYDSSNNCYYVYEDVNDSETCYDQYKYELTMGSDVYLFDTAGRLIRVTDEHGNKIIMTYSSNRLTSITDGAGREFGLSYNANGFLTAITAPDNTVISYAYTGNLLTSITYPDGKTATITYASNKPTSVVLKDVTGKAVYKVAYAFSGNRLISVTEYGVDADGAFVTGVSSAYSYSVASGRTLVTTTEPKDIDEGETEDNETKTVYTFDDDGNVVSEYAYSEDTGNVGVTCSESGINPNNSSEYASNANNLLTGHNFESLSAWISEAGNCSDTSIGTVSGDANTKFGTVAMRMETCSTDCVENGVYQVTNTLPAGEYTFSAYIRMVSAVQGSANRGVYLRVTDTSGNILTESEKLIYADSEYVRLNTSFSLEGDQSVIVHVLIDGKGIVYVDAAQLENNPFVNVYNMLENGNFERGVDGWGKTSGVGISTGTRFNMQKALMMTGDIESSRYSYQDVKVKSAVGTLETFTLSGWAMGYGLPNHERDGVSTPKFEMRAVIYYKDNTTETFVAPFSPCTEEWQFASVQVAKTSYKEIKKIRVYCDYGYNVGYAFFDDVQLVRNSIETGLSKSDIEGDETSSDGGTTENTTAAFTEALDAYGNALTETTFTDGQLGTIYRSFAYNTDDTTMAGDNSGNDLIRETDARGNKTYYAVDDDTSRNEEITDRCGNKTAYEYDSEGRTTKVTSKDANNNELANVSYAYDGFNNMTEIVRGDGLKYVLAYNDFHNLESIGVNGKSEKLIAYTYKNGNGRLKQMTYANGDTMKATYNSLGQMTGETWYNASGVETARYKYVYDGAGNLNRSIDIYAKKEYNYEYDEGKIIRAAESDIILNGELVIGRTLANTVRYYYDAEGQLTKKVITPAGKASFAYTYNNTKNVTTVQFTAGGRMVTSQSNTDHLGRKTFDELQLGVGNVYRQFSYHAGAVTEEHIAGGKEKSTATTQLVSKITFSDGRTIAYEYDAEERITKVIDSVEGTVRYTYDALGQLLTETKNGVVINTMAYDNYGNIKNKNGKSYTYDSTWKDLLTSYNGQSIIYDAQGNPTSYLGHALTWEKGRQLKSFDNNTYTYNANDIRTSKTVDGVRHMYTLDDTKILFESWENNTLISLYDNKESVCGIIYNNTPYYFLKNLQGDIIAIADAAGTVVAEYSYDAWGKCTIAYDCCGIASINPYRYRGYYHDVETGYYYVCSRYYDPEIGRFMNSDDSITLAFGSGKMGHNLLGYCENNPVNNKDVSGYIAANIVGAAIGAIIGVVGGVFLGNWLADVLKLSGWKRGVFVAAVAALVGAAAGAIGYFIGPYVAKIATKLGHYVLELLKKGKIAFQKLSNSVKSSIRALGKCACFVAGTLVLTEKGLVPIEEIVSGDEVWSENICTGETGYKGVVRTFVNQVDTLVKLSFLEEEIKTTVNHPFWVVGSGWKSASKLQPGDKVKRGDGTIVDVLEIEIVYLDTTVNVYNFEVVDWHTYFVGNTSILVHNMCPKEFVKSPKNAKQVLKYLKEQGFKVVSQNGSHIKLTDGLKTTTVPMHGARDLATGTLRAIMKQAGLL